MNRGALRTLLVDDEPIARSVLREGLQDFPEIQIVGEAENGKQALQRITDLRPDLVFLDLQMPLMGGFEVIHKLDRGELPVIVVVTAFDEHALAAFDAGAVDYLLKPLGAERLRMAVERARAFRRSPAENAKAIGAIVSAAGPQASEGARKIVGRSGSDYLFLDPDDILAFQADGELVWIVTAKQRLLATQPLWSIEKRLSGQQFQRVHRSAIVNMNHIRKVSSISSQRWMITLSNSLQLIASKRLAHNIRRILHW